MANLPLFVCSLVALLQLGPPDADSKGLRQRVEDSAKYDFNEQEADIWASVLKYEGDCEAATRGRSRAKCCPSQAVLLGARVAGPHLDDPGPPD